MRKASKGAKADAIFFGSVFSEMKRRKGDISNETQGVKNIRDCIGKHITLKGFHDARCTIAGIYGTGKRKTFKMFTAEGIRHNIMVNSVYKNKKLKTELRALI